MTSTVLIIEDDVAMTQILRSILEPHAFIILTSCQIQEGLEVARERKPDVIILDLPGTELDGGQLCRTIRAFTHIPILILSAMNKPGAVAQALNEGADDYLIKPVSAGVLIAHLNNLIRRAHAENIARTASVNPL